jgi:hypothetical protein
MAVDFDVVRVRVLPDGRLDRKNAALYLGRSPKTLAQWALQGKGPRSHDIGGRAFYYLQDCDEFITAARRNGTPRSTPPPSADPKRPRNARRRRPQ